MKSIIYYTDNRVKEPIRSLVQKHLLESGLPIVSSSLEPMDFGDNEVYEGERSYPTMVAQILSCLTRAETEYVFFCEHDVLYPKSHFDFTPLEDNIFYYNENVWRWWMGDDKLIRHDRMLPLSCLVVNREYALEHYQLRQRMINEMGLDHFRSREPRLARRWGYEPGTKKIKRGGLTDDDFDTFFSHDPVIDIRHKDTFSSPKIKLDDFKHRPNWWTEIDINEVPGWDLRGMFNGA